MDVKLQALLFLCLSAKLIQESEMEMHHCNTTTILRSCHDNPRIQVMKSENHYKLKLCFNNQSKCIYIPPKNWINCTDVCKICYNILSPSPSEESACQNGTACEKQVDTLLNDYCAKFNATLTHPMPNERVITTTIIEPTTTVMVQTCSISGSSHTLPTPIRPSTVTVTLSPKCTASAQIGQNSSIATCPVCSVSTIAETVTVISAAKQPACPTHSGTCDIVVPSSSLKTSPSTAAVIVSLSVSTTTTTTTTRHGQSFSKMECSSTLEIVLGVFLGAFMLLSLVISAMWVLTCLIKKKRKAKKTSKLNMNTAVTVHTNSTTEQDCEDEIERHFDNPVYEDSNTIEPNTSSQNGSHELEKIPPVTYDIVNLPTNMAAADNGQTYDVLNRGQAKCNGGQTARQGERLFKDNYSKLSIH